MGLVEVVVDIASLTLGTVTEQALSSDFLAAEDHPRAVFSAEIRRDGADYVADGDLTLKGATIPVSLPFTLEIEGDTATADGGLTLDRRTFAIGTGYKDEKSLAFSVEVSVHLTATRS
jgi:polyisoprenoid-binding protein YceI